jgi:hypothetical protein
MSPVVQGRAGNKRGRNGLPGNKQGRRGPGVERRTTALKVAIPDLTVEAHHEPSHNQIERNIKSNVTSLLAILATVG